MYARVPQATAQFVLKTEEFSHIMGPTPILELARAYGLRPDYGSWSYFKNSQERQPVILELTASDGFYRLWKVKLKTGHDFIKFYIL